MQAQIRKIPFDIHLLSVDDCGDGANVNTEIAVTTGGELVLKLQDDGGLQSNHTNRALAFFALSTESER